MLDPEQQLEIIKEANEVLDHVHLESFTASPERIRPFQQSVLTWRLTISDPPPGHFLLRLKWPGGTMNLGPTGGSQSFSPTTATTYNLEAVRPPASRRLGSRTIEVDTSECLNLSISEQDVRAQITKAIDGLLAQHPLSRRRPDSVEIDQAGIHLKLALEAHVTGFNPKVTISGLIKLWAENGQPRYALVNYATSVSYSNPLGELVDWVASLFSESDVEGSIRKYLTAEIETFLATLERLINVTNSRLLSIEAASDEINNTICPKE